MLLFFLQQTTSEHKMWNILLLRLHGRLVFKKLFCVHFIKHCCGLNKTQKLQRSQRSERKRKRRQGIASHGHIYLLIAFISLLSLRCLLFCDRTPFRRTVPVSAPRTPSNHYSHHPPVTLVKYRFVLTVATDTSECLVLVLAASHRIASHCIAHRTATHHIT